MDVGAFVASLAVVLTPYAVKGAEKIAGKVAEDVYDKVKGILGSIRNRLRGKPEAETALEKFEAEPANAETQAALIETLRQQTAAQPDFQEELLKLAQSLVETLKDANERGAKYKIDADQIIGVGDHNTFNFQGVPPPPAKQED